MLIEDKLSKNSILNIASFLLFYGDAKYENSEDLQDLINVWNNKVADLRVNLPRGQHDNDCNGVLYTCDRCLIEGYAEKAEEVLNDIRFRNNIDK